jgi:nitrate/nitrite transporter NarK
MIIASASAGLNVAAMYKQFASISPALKGDSYQSLVGAVGALFNAMGRLFWGALSDKIGFKNSFMILTVAQAAVQFLYPYSAVSKVSSFILLLRLVDY